MITKNELIEFKNFCANRHNIKIRNSVIEEFLHSRKVIEFYSSTSTSNEEIQCGYDAPVCAHVNFNSVKCDACTYL